MEADPAPGVSATESAVAEIGRLKAEHAVRSCSSSRGAVATAAPRCASTTASGASGRPEPARYAVFFRAGTSGPTAGALVVDDRRFMLIGGNNDNPIELSVPYSDLRDVRIGRSNEERLNGRPALMLARDDGPVVQVVPFGFGLLHELAELLATLTRQQSDERNEQVAVVVPLKTQCVERAKELVAKGPPFDPAALGLDRHQIFVNEREALFIFTGPNVRAKLQQATRNPSLWRAGLAWRACIAGPPRLTNPDEGLPVHTSQPLYSWAADDT